MRAPTETETAESITNAKISPPLPLDIVEDAPWSFVSQGTEMIQVREPLTDALDEEAALAEPAAEEDAAVPEPEAFDDPEAEAVDEPGAEAGVAADSFSTPAVSSTGTLANSLPVRVVVVSTAVLVDVTSGMSTSKLYVTWQTAAVVPLIWQVSEAEASTPMVWVANW